MKHHSAGLIPVLVQIGYSTCMMAESFDYVVIGGGTAGLVVANRLSENPLVRVVVIEPGGDERNNPNVTGTDSFTKALNTSIDWGYWTVPQPGVNNEPLQYHQGKAIGGTSTINGMTYIRGNAAELDAWETLGNTGWNWASIYPYYKRSERFTEPSRQLQAAGVTFDAVVHGDSGPVHTGYPWSFSNSTATLTVREAWERLGLPHNVDPAGGNVYGVSTHPQTIDRDLDVRWDAARAYWHPVDGRPNLRIIRGTALRLKWADSSSSQQTERQRCSGERASGVEYLTEDGHTAVLSVTNEVIISAGTVRSPLILEASGVGNPSILNTLGIPVKIDLPGVGENFQEQPNNVIFYSSTANATGDSISQTFASAANIFGGSLPEIVAHTHDKLPQWADQIVAASGGAGVLNRSAVEKLLRVQHDLVFREGATFAEYLTAINSDGTLVSVYWILFPFSRGSVHLASSDVAKLNEPKIDPRLNLVDFDLTAQTQAGRLTDKIWFEGPLSSLRSARVKPGPDVLPENATEAQWTDFTRTTTTLNFHGIGTASMMSRELGGVVDPLLRVYGTSNVRVVDMSIFPLPLSGHPTATLYAVAERAADIIKESALHAS